MKQKKEDAVKISRCAIYTRKSTEEGLEQEFNSLDAQREAGEKFIESQRGEGRICLPDRYDDGGFTGGNVPRSNACLRILPLARSIVWWSIKWTACPVLSALGTSSDLRLPRPTLCFLHQKMSWFPAEDGRPKVPTKVT